jgi:hypothetical protein
VKTNVEFVVELMEFSEQGALMQMFVMTALEKYAQAALQERLPEDFFIHPDAWQRCATEVLEKVEKRLCAQ